MNCLCPDNYYLKEIDEKTGAFLSAKQCVLCDKGAWPGPQGRSERTLVRECRYCPVLGQLYDDGTPFVCRCSMNVLPGYVTAGDTCFL